MKDESIMSVLDRKKISKFIFPGNLEMFYVHIEQVYWHDVISSCNAFFYFFFSYSLHGFQIQFSYIFILTLKKFRCHCSPFSKWSLLVKTGLIFWCNTIPLGQGEKKLWNNFRYPAEKFWNDKVFLMLSSQLDIWLIWKTSCFCHWGTSNA